MANIVTMGRTRMMAALSAVRSRLANIREAAEEAAERGVVVLGSPIGGGLAGFVAGRAERDNKDITIGDSEIRWTVPIAMGVAAAGAFLPRLTGRTLANGALGIGCGAIGFESGMWGYKKGLKPASA